MKRFLPLFILILFSACSGSNEMESKVREFIDKSTEYFEQGDFEAAYNISQEAFKYFDRLNMPGIALRFFKNQAYFKLQAEEIPQAKEDALAALAYYSEKKAENNEALYQLYGILGQIDLYYERNAKTAEDYFKKALALENNLAFDELAVKTHKDYAHSLASQDKINEALNEFESLASILKSSNSFDEKFKGLYFGELSQIYLYLIQTARESENEQDALEYTRKSEDSLRTAIDFLESSGNSDYGMLASLYLDLANLAENQNRKDDRIKYAEIAVKDYLHIEKRNHTQVATNAFTVGNYYKSLGENKKALDYFQISYEDLIRFRKSIQAGELQLTGKEQFNFLNQIEVIKDRLQELGASVEEPDKITRIGTVTEYDNKNKTVDFFADSQRITLKCESESLFESLKNQIPGISMVFQYYLKGDDKMLSYFAFGK